MESEYLNEIHQLRTLLRERNAAVYEDPREIKDMNEALQKENNALRVYVVQLKETAVDLQAEKRHLLEAIKVNSSTRISTCFTMMQSCDLAHSWNEFSICLL